MGTSGCFGDTFKIPLQHSPYCHGSYIHKVLQTHVIDATCRENNVRPWRQNLLNTLLSDVWFPKVTTKKKKTDFRTNKDNLGLTNQCLSISVSTSNDNVTIEIVIYFILCEKNLCKHINCLYCDVQVSEDMTMYSSNVNQDAHEHLCLTVSLSWDYFIPRV